MNMGRKRARSRIGRSKLDIGDEVEQPKARSPIAPVEACQLTTEAFLQRSTQKTYGRPKGRRHVYAKEEEEEPDEEDASSSTSEPTAKRRGVMASQENMRTGNTRARPPQDIRSYPHMVQVASHRNAINPGTIPFQKKKPIKKNALSAAPKSQRGTKRKPKSHMVVAPLRFIPIAEAERQYAEVYVRMDDTFASVDTSWSGRDARPKRIHKLTDLLPLKAYITPSPVTPSPILPLSLPLSQHIRDPIASPPPPVISEPIHEEQQPLAQEYNVMIMFEDASFPSQELHSVNEDGPVNEAFPSFTRFERIAPPLEALIPFYPTVSPLPPPLSIVPKPLTSITSKIPTKASSTSSSSRRRRPIGAFAPKGPQTSPGHESASSGLLSPDDFSSGLLALLGPGKSDVKCEEKEVVMEVESNAPIEGVADTVGLTHVEKERDPSVEELRIVHLEPDLSMEVEEHSFNPFHADTTKTTPNLSTIVPDPSIASPFAHIARMRSSIRPPIPTWNRQKSNARVRFSSQTKVRETEPGLPATAAVAAAPVEENSIPEAVVSAPVVVAAATKPGPPSLKERKRMQLVNQPAAGPSSSSPFGSVVVRNNTETPQGKRLLQLTRSASDAAGGGRGESSKVPYDSPEEKKMWLLARMTSKDQAAAAKSGGDDTFAPALFSIPVPVPPKPSTVSIARSFSPVIHIPAAEPIPLSSRPAPSLPSSGSQLRTINSLIPQIAFLASNNPKSPTASPASAPPIIKKKGRAPSKLLSLMTDLAPKLTDIARLSQQEADELESSLPLPKRAKTAVKRKKKKVDDDGGSGGGSGAVKALKRAKTKA